MKAVIKHILLAAVAALTLAACSEQESAPTPTETASSGGTPSPNKGLDYDYYVSAVEPIFLRHRGGFVGTDTSCVACHTTQANAPLGLQPLTEENGNVFWTEEQSRQRQQLANHCF